MTIKPGDKCLWRSTVGGWEWNVQIEVTVVSVAKKTAVVELVNKRGIPLRRRVALLQLHKQEQTK